MGIVTAFSFLVFVFSFVLALRLTAVSGASIAQLSHAAHAAAPAVRQRLSFHTLLLAVIVHFGALSNRTVSRADPIGLFWNFKCIISNTISLPFAWLQLTRRSSYFLGRFCAKICLKMLRWICVDITKMTIVMPNDEPKRSPEGWDRIPFRSFKYMLKNAGVKRWSSRAKFWS